MPSTDGCAGREPTRHRGRVLRSGLCRTVADSTPTPWSVAGWSRTEHLAQFQLLVLDPSYVHHGTACKGLSQMHLCRRETQRSSGLFSWHQLGASAPSGRTCSLWLTDHARSAVGIPKPPRFTSGSHKRALFRILSRFVCFPDAVSYYSTLPSPYSFSRIFPWAYGLSCTQRNHAYATLTHILLEWPVYPLRRA